MKTTYESEMLKEIKELNFNLYRITENLEKMNKNLNKVNGVY